MHILLYLQNYKEFGAEILDLQLEKYGLSFDVKKCTTSSWALGDENVIGIRAFKVCLCDIDIQSYVLSKLVKNKGKHSNFKIILFISAKLLRATCGRLSQITSHIYIFLLLKMINGFSWPAENHRQSL